MRTIFTFHSVYGGVRRLRSGKTKIRSKTLCFSLVLLLHYKRVGHCEYIICIYKYIQKKKEKKTKFVYRTCANFVLILFHCQCVLCWIVELAIAHVPVAFFFDIDRGIEANVI